MTLRVLLVEDDRELRKTLRDALGVEGHEVLTAASLSEGLALATHAGNPGGAAGSPGIDLVVLDLGLPDGDGEALLAALRRKHSTPVLVISARQADGQKIRLLDAGADDYLVKPFSIGELLARMRVALRHRGTTVQAALTHYRHAGLTVDLARQQRAPQRPGDPPDADRIQAARPPGAQRRAGGHAPPAAGRRLGRRVRGTHALPAALHGSAARQARGPTRPSLRCC